MQNSLFFPGGGRDHCRCSLKLSTEAEASKGIPYPSDENCVTKILGGRDKKEVKEGKTIFLSRENKHIKPIKQSNKCVEVYV